VPGKLDRRLGGPGLETDHLPPSGAKLKNTWSCTFTLPYDFTTGCLVKHRDVILRNYLAMDFCLQFMRISILCN